MGEPRPCLDPTCWWGRGLYRINKSGSYGHGPWQGWCWIGRSKACWRQLGEVYWGNDRDLSLGLAPAHKFRLFPGFSLFSLFLRCISIPGCLLILQFPGTHPQWFWFSLSGLGAQLPEILTDTQAASKTGVYGSHLTNVTFDDYIKSRTGFYLPLSEVVWRQSVLKNVHTPLITVDWTWTCCWLSDYILGISQEIKLM